MFASREQMLEYRTQVTQVARWIDVFRRSYFHGQYQGVAEGRFTAGDLDKVLALAEVRAYDRVEHGRLEHVGEHQAWLGSLDYRLDRDPDDYHHELTAHLPGSGTKVGAIDWYGRNGDMWSEPGDPRIARTVNGLTVHSDFQRRGLATELWRRASSVQPGLAHSEGLSPEGAAWKESLGHGVSTPEEFHAKYLPKYQVRLDYLKAEADRISRLALDPSSPGWAKAEKAALDAHAKYDAAVKAAVAKTVARNKLGLTADTVATPAGPKKGQASVHYRDGSGTKDCGSCSMVRIMPPDFETLTCTAVKGPIREDGVCDIWAPSPEDGALHKLTDAQVENALLALTTVDPYKRVVAGKMQIVRSYDRKQGRFVDVLGHRHWGWYGGAGILPVHVDEHDTIRYGLQKRAGGVQHSGSYSTAGGAIDKLPSGEIETPVQAALREAEEEFGKIPEGEVTKVYTDQHGISGEPGSWAYHTVHVKYPEMFKPDAKASHASESGGIKWVTAEEMGKLPLHPDFRTYAEAHLGVQADPAKQPKDYTIAQEAPPDQDFRKDDVIEYHHKGNGVDAVIKAKVMLEPDKKHPTYLVQPALWYEKDGKPFKQVELKRQHILTAPPGHPPKTGGELKTGPVDMPPPREPGEVRTGDEVKWTGEDGKERAGRVTYVHSEGSVDVAPPPPPPPTFGKGKFKTGDRVAHRDKEGNIKAGVVTGAEDTKDKWGPFTAYHVKYDDGSEGDHAADRLVNEKYAKSLKAGGHSSGGSTSYFKAKVTGGGSYGLGTQTGFKPSASAPMPGTLAQGDKVTFYDPNEDLDRSGTVTEADSEGRIIITSDNGDRYSVSPVEYHDVHLQRVIPPKAKAPKGSMSPTTGGKAKPKFSEGDTVKRRSFTANDWDHGRITAANVAVSALGYPVHQVEFDHGTANVPESMLKKA
jgi:8-oxo-dGTP pyrophosphatase MutT (NUDIX family)/GNAT superfamily N-acetyltransferase